MALGLALLACGGVALAAGEDSFVPDWTKGQKWYVESRRVPMTLEGDSAAPKPEFAPPMLWEYSVAAVRDTGGLRYYQIVVKESVGKDVSRAGLVFIAQLGAAGRPKLLTLAKATFESPFRGTTRRVTHDYRAEVGGPHPVMTTESLIPVEIPCFSAASFGATTVTTFDVTDMSGGLPFARDIVQSIRRSTAATRSVTEPLAFRGPVEPIRVAVEADAARDLEVLLERPSDGAVVHQIWNPAQPWWLYSRSHAGVSRLVRKP